MHSCLPIVLDNGCYKLRAGFSGDCLPRLDIYNSFGKPRSYKSVFKASTAKSHYFAEDLCEKRGLLRYDSAYDSKNNLDINKQSLIWHHVFYEQLRIAPEEHNILISCSPNSTLREKQSIVHSLFENFDFPAAFLTESSILNLYSYGKSSGLSVDISYMNTRIFGYWDAFKLNDVKEINCMGGYQLEKLFSDELLKKGITLDRNNSQIDIIRNMIENYCFISKKSPINTSIEPIKIKLPDCSEITLANELCDLTESYFNPESFYIEAKSLSQSIKDAIGRAPIDIRKSLFKNILLSGGSSMLKNLDFRINNELPNHFRVLSSDDRNYSTWFGGSIVSSIDSLEWIKKSDYMEIGPSIVNRYFN
ncbi:MAG: hypothetical protein MHPSP_001532 [Paramarteilia canceri]